MPTTVQTMLARVLHELFQGAVWRANQDQSISLAEGRQGLGDLIDVPDHDFLDASVERSADLTRAKARADFDVPPLAFGKLREHIEQYQSLLARQVREPDCSIPYRGECGEIATACRIPARDPSRLRW